MNKMKPRDLAISLNDELFDKMKISEFKLLGKRFFLKISIGLLPEVKFITDSDEKQELLKKYHNDPILGGHCGKRRLYLKLKMYFYWKNMTYDIDEFIKNCENCQKN